MASKTPRVLWRSRYGAAALRDRPAPDDLDLILQTDPERAAADAEGASILVDGDPPEALLDAAGLRHVVVPWAGVTAGVARRLRERPHLTLHNSHFNAPFVAQHAFALLMACAARLGRYDRALRRGDWGARGDPESVSLAGGEALLLGYGAIGRALAPMLRGVGMNVTALRRRPDPHARDVREVGPERLHEALAAARAVVVSLPATDATRGLLDAAALGALREGALFVNVGRASVVDEDALWEALHAGRLAGAGLDVWWRYPEDRAARRATLPSRRPFHLHPDVITSPHRADLADGAEAARLEDVLTTVRDLAAGGDRNRVDPDAGY